MREIWDFFKDMLFYCFRLYLIAKIFLFFFSRTGGLGLMAAYIILWVMFFWMPGRDRLGTGSMDSERKDETNPLYKKEWISKKEDKPKRGSIFTADLKWDYICQVIAAVQIGVFMLYGIYSAAHEFRRFETVENILSIWALIHLIFTILMRFYYNLIFDVSYIRTPVGKWEPFLFTGDRRFSPLWIDTDYLEFRELKDKLFISCRDRGYTLVQEKKIAEEKKIWLFAKKEGKNLKLVELIRLHSLEREDILLLNEAFQEFYERIPKKDRKKIRIYFTFLFCVDEETRTFRNILNRSVIPGIRRYRLPAGITLDNGRIQIAAGNWRYGDISYKKMQQELYDIMGIKEPII